MLNWNKVKMGGVGVEGDTHTLISSVLAVCNFSLKWGSVSNTSMTSLRYRS